MNLANFVNSGHSKQHQIHPDFDDIIVSIHSACTVLLVKDPARNYLFYCYL